jgi:hypothetical protein
MKKLVTLTLTAITALTLAMPAFAQDEFVLTGGDIDALLGGGRNNNQNRNNNQPQIPDPITMFEELKALLKNNKASLDKNQEKALQTFLNTETVAMRTALEAQFQNRGGRGGNNNNNQLTIIQDLQTEVTKHNAELLTEIKAGLTPDQVNLLTKAEKDKKVCTVMVDLVNFQALRTRFQNQQNNFRGGGPGGFDGGGLDNLPIGLDLGGGGGGNRGGGNRGGNNNFQNQISSLLPERASCTSKNSKPAERVAVLGDIMTKGKKPLTADQEAKFAPMAEKHVAAILEELKTKDQNVDRMINDLNNQGNNNNQNNQTQANQTPPQINVQTITNNIVNTILSNLGIQTNNNNNQNNQNNRGGGRGNFPNNNNQNNPQGQNNTPQQANNNQGNNQANNQANNQNNQNNNFNRGNNNQNNQNNNFNNFNPQQEIQKKNEELLDKVAAMLKPDQGNVVKKMKVDQIKSRGGVDRYRGILEQEGTPLTPEQITTIQNLLNVEATQVRNAAQVLVQAKIQALPAGALQAAYDAQWRAQQQQLQQQQQQNRNNNNNNQNNVNQNQVAQQIIGDVLPDVSKQHARFKAVVEEQILKQMTPPQQASYKINMMTK